MKTKRTNTAKKIIVLGIVLLLVVGIIPNSLLRINATEGTTYNTVFTIETGAGKPGETIEIGISVSGDKEVSGLLLKDLEYDRTALEFIEFKSYGALITESMTGEYSVGKESITLGYSPNIIPNGEICAISFKIKEEAEDGDYTVSFSTVLSSNNGTNVPSKIQEGTITVSRWVAGDFDGNDVVDMYDAVYFIGWVNFSYIPGLYPMVYDGDKDFNHDGVIDMYDAVYLIGWINFSFIPGLYEINWDNKPVHSHTITAIAAKDATCTEAGNTAYWHCSACGKYFSDADGKTEIAENSWVVTALGHNYVNGKCTRCGDEEHTVPTTYSTGLSFTSNGNGTCYVSGIGTCTDTDIVIPPTSPAGDSVTSVGYWAFEDCSSLTSIEIPNSVTSIGGGAFRNCSSLTSITIPNSVTSIEYFAFEGCSSLTSIEIPSSVTSIDERAFSWCTSLTAVNVDENNEYYSSENGVLYNKNKTTLVCVPSGISGDFVISNSVTSIGNYAFYNCSSLTSIDIPKSVTSIGNSAFSWCAGLTSIVIPNGVMSIGEWAFIGCSSLTSIMFSENSQLISIGSRAFRNCSSLTSVTFSKNSQLTSIGYGVFSECGSLTSITIPDSVTSIGESAFESCTSLTTVYYTGTEAEWNKISIGYYNNSLKNAKKVYNYTPTAHEHTWGAGVVTKAATCTETGVMTYTCSSCGETKTEAIARLAHTVEIIPGKAATCTETGLTQGEKCSVCQTVLVRQEVIAALGHNYVEKERHDATCTEDGYILYECSLCHVEKRQSEIATGHSYGYDNICDICGHEAVIHNHKYTTEVIAPTCTKMGYTLFTCECGDSYKANYIDQLGHSWNDGVEEKAPTCTETGIVRYTCTVCGESYTAQIQISHKWNEVRHDATCTEDGEVVRTCSICGEVEREVLPAEHKWNVKEVIQEPSCDADGKQIVVCGVCGEEEEQSIPAKGHIFQNGVCTVCGKKFIEAVSEQVEHPVYGMFFLLDEVTSNYGPETVNEYGVLLYVNEGAELDKVAVYLTQDGTMWRRCIACTGNNIEFAYYVPYLSYGNDILYTGLNSPYINTFALKKGSDGIWRYSEYATIGANLADNKGNLLLSLYQIGQAGAKTRIFDDLSEMKAWLKGVDGAHVHTIVTDEAIPATCTTNGMTAGSHCSVCGEVITAREVVNALGHNYVNGKCTRCGDEEHTVPATYSEGLKFTSNGDGTCYVSGIGTCKDTDIVIPPTSPNGDSVTSVGYWAFNGCSGLTSVVIPNSVTSIGEFAFSHCGSLTSIEIPSSVTSIGNGAFDGCINLIAINVSVNNEYFSSENGVLYSKDKTILLCVPEGINGEFIIPSSVTSIGDGAFRNCSSLTSIVIPNSVTSMGSQAFYNCSSLTSVTFGENSQLTSIARVAFSVCSNLTSIVIPNSVTSIDDYAFSDCSSLTSVAIPNSVTSIGDYAFSDCSSLTSVAIPNSVTSIGDYAFSSCRSLKTVYYTGTEAEWNKISIGSYNALLMIAKKVYNYQPSTPVVTYSEGLAFTSNGDGTCYVSGIGTCKDTDIVIPPTSPKGDKVTFIGNQAFYECTGLTSITMPESVTSIGNNAFTECTSLASIVIPNSVTSIGEWVFIGCSSLTAINVDGNNEYYSSENGVLYNKDKTKLICVPGGMSGNLTIPRGVTIIGECALYGCCITSIEIPDSVISIDRSSFFGCSNLTNLTIPNGVTSIGNGAFSNCSSITNIVIPDSVTSIGIPMFFGCDSLTNIEVSEKNPYFSSKDGVMYNKNGSTLAAVPCGLSGNFVIPSGVTSIGDSALDGCTKLTSIEIPNSVTSIGEYALYFCSSLTNITIPNRVTNIGNGAFGNCTSLISITIPKSVIIIGDRIVDFCDKLTTVYYTGTETEWNIISIGSSNESLVKLTKVYNYTPTPHKHTWGAGVVTKAATCTETGVMTYTCSCGETKTEVISKLAHTVEIIPGKAATCTETGLTQGEKCSVCKTVLVVQNIIPALGHNYVNGKCTRCGDEEHTVPATYSEGLAFTSNGNGTCYVSGIGTCKDTDIVIPPTSPAGDSVTSVGYRAFYECGNITSVVIPKGVTSIGDSAFVYCGSLTSIEIPNSVTSIGNTVFYECTSLTSVEMPNSVTSIGNGAFYGCNSLVSITIPNGVTTIGDFAFYNCSGLTSIVIPNSVTIIGQSAFNECSGLTSIVIPNSVTSIGETAFSGCRSLTSIVIPNSVTSIGEAAFSGCRSLTSITIPSNVTSIGERAFEGCTNLTAINVDEDNEYYSSETGVLYNKDKTTLVCVPGGISGEFEIPNGVTRIGEAAFSGCRSLTSIEIPNSVITIGIRAFYGCSSLTSIVIPNGVTSIGDYAFSWCTGLTSITIPNSITSIGDGAFACCRGLTIITIPNSLTSIGYGAFSDCRSLTSIVIPNGVTSIGGEAFRDCSSLISIVIPNSVTSIDDYAFFNCTVLTSIAIPNSVTSIGESAFESCTSLASVYYTGTEAEWNKISIGNYNDPLKNATKVYNYQPSTPVVTYSEGLAFTSNGNGTCYVSGIGTCKDTDIVIPPTSPDGDSVTSIGNRAFNGRRKLTSIAIPNSVTSIGEWAFSNCSSLTNVTFGEKSQLTSIGNYAFRYCSSLTSIEIPNGVTSMGERAFNDCSNLTSITMPNGVTSISDYSFSGCSGLTSIVIPKSVTDIGEFAFNGCSNLTSINVDEINEYYSSENGALYNKDKTTLVCVSGGRSGEFEIPNGVTRIGNYAFNGCSLTSIAIPNSVTSIGDYAFYNCSSLTSVTFGENSQLTSIGKIAFCECSSLTSIVIPNNVTSIGKSAFMNCSSLTSVTFGGKSQLTSIGNGAFSWCRGLTSITIPSSVTRIDEDAFNGCSRLMSVTIPNSVTNIGAWAFSGCSSLTSVDIPDSVTGIGAGAYSGCSSLKAINVDVNNKNYSSENGALYNKDKTTLVCVPGGTSGMFEIPSSVTSIDAGAFRYCSGITSIVIPNSVMSIGNSAFSDCSSLTSIAIPNSVTSIGQFAFIRCTNLTSITIPNSVTSIGDYTFEGCTNLTAINVDEDNKYYSSENGALYNKDKTTLVCVPGGISGMFEIPSSVTSVGYRAFYQSGNITGVVIPNSVTSIGNDAFYNCSSLTTVYYTGTEAEWKKISIGLSNNTLLNATKVYNYQPTTPVVTYSEGLAFTSNGDGTCYVSGIGTCKDTDIVIPPTSPAGDSVTSIGFRAFYQCGNITSVVIPNSVTSIGSHAFVYCSSLTSIEIPSSITSIGAGVFFKCSSLTSITIPNSVTSISNSAFYGCSRLTSIAIPNSVTSIGGGAFDRCSSLTSIVIPNSVTSIGNDAFYNCSSLTTVYYGGTEAQWVNISIGNNNDPLKNATKVYNAQ